MGCVCHGAGSQGYTAYRGAGSSQGECVTRAYDRIQSDAIGAGSIQRPGSRVPCDVSCSGCSQVQRPGLRQLFDIDLKNLKILAEQLDKGSEDGR